MNKFMLCALAFLLVVCLVACGVSEEPATTTTIVSPTIEESVSAEAEQLSDGTIRPSNSVDRSYLTLERLKELTWEELLASDWSPVTDEDNCLFGVIQHLDNMGNVFRSTSVARATTQIREAEELDYNRLKDKLDMLREVYNSSEHTYWSITHILVDRDINFLTDETTEVRATVNAEEFILKHPASMVGEYVIVTDNYTPPASSPEGFGFGSHLEVTGALPNPVNAGDVMIVSGFSYLTNTGKVIFDINIPFSEFEELCAPVLRNTDEEFWMVHLCNIHGEYVGSFLPDTILPLSVIHPEALSEDLLNDLRYQLPNIDEMLVQVDNR